MHEGAFVLIDCLGFKGIWRRRDQTRLLEGLRGIMQKVHPQLMVGLPFHLLRRDFIITPSLLSDSVAISLRYMDDPTKQEVKRKKKLTREKSYLVWLICASTIRVLDLYLKAEPSLALRGCITYGEYEHNITETGSFIVGPAVDVAAENMEKSQGAFVWLHPGAAKLYRYAIKVQQKTIKLLHKSGKNPELLKGSIDSLCEPLMVDPYDMPLKGGGRYKCPVINPLAFHKIESEYRGIRDAYEKALSGNDLDVWLKQQNTLEFLERAKEARQEYEDWCDEFIASLGMVKP